MDQNIINNLPLVSVLMPAYNVEKYIGASIDSILNQEYKNLELIIIDDASTDSTLNIIQCYKDSRLVCLKNLENLGVTKCRNKLISLAKGEFIAFLDSDDIAIASRLKLQVFFLNKNPQIDLVGSRIQYMNESGNKIFFKRSDKFYSIDQIKTDLLFNNVLSTSTVMFRSKIKEYMYNNEVYNIGEDYYIWVSLILKNCKFSMIDEKLVKYRIRKSSSTNLYISDIKNSFDKIHSLFLDFLNIEITKEKLNVHNSLFVPNSDFKSDYLLNSENLYHEIIDSNNKYNIFNSSVLIESIEKNWYLKCRRSVRYLGYKSFIYYNNSFFKKAKYSFLLIAYYFYHNIIKLLNNYKN